MDQQLRPIQTRSGPRLLAVITMAASLCLEMPARACSVCGCGDPLLAASDSAPVAGQLRLDVSAEYLRATARSDDDPEVTESLSQATLSMVAVWSPSQQANLVLKVPLMLKRFSATDGQAASPWGLGDVDLGARLVAARVTDFRTMTRQSLALQGGVSLPTGREGDAVDGLRLDQHAQLGTGAFGPYLGVQYRVEHDPWNGFVSVSGRTRTENPYGYRFGDALQWTALVQLHPFERLALALALDGRLADHDMSGARSQENTGGFALAATPGLLFNVTGEVWVSAKVQVPFLVRLYGEQTIGPTVVAGVQYLVF